MLVKPKVFHLCENCYLTGLHPVKNWVLPNKRKIKSSRDRTRWSFPENIKEIVKFPSLNYFTSPHHPKITAAGLCSTSFVHHLRHPTLTQPRQLLQTSEFRVLHKFKALLQRKLSANFSNLRQDREFQATCIKKKMESL